MCSRVRRFTVASEVNWLTMLKTCPPLWVQHWAFRLFVRSTTTRSLDNLSRASWLDYSYRPSAEGGERLLPGRSSTSPHGSMLLWYFTPRMTGRSQFPVQPVRWPLSMNNHPIEALWAVVKSQTGWVRDWHGDDLLNHQPRYLADLRLIESLTPAGTVLEVGSAPCHMTALLSLSGFSVVGVDVDPT